MSEQRCENCRFFHKNVDQGWEEGWCLRYPPMFKNDDEHGTVPPVTAHHWCGEYQPKDTDQ